MKKLEPAAAAARSDEELVRDHLNGDASAFPLLVERHLKSVYAFALRFVGSAADAEDISQEAFLKVWKNLHKYSRKSASVKTWLMRIVRNTSIDYLRKRKSIPFSAFENDEGATPFDDLSDETPLVDELAAHAEDTAAVEAAVQELPPLYREVLLLYYGDHLTFDAVAEVLRIRANTVKSRHRRALAKLKAVLVHRK